jgi:AcrR family transcriptional regulator
MIQLRMSASIPEPTLLSAPQRPPNLRAKERILAAAYDLFSRHGIRAVGIDAIIEKSGVARMTLYRHFTCKEQLVLAFLEQRARFWASGWLQEEIMRRAQSPRERLLAIFDVFGEWFRVEGFEGCTFINVMLETPDRDDKVRRASVDYLGKIREFLAQLAGDAGIRDRDGFARKWHILMKGSIVAAAEGDRDAGVRAREMGSLVLADTLAREASEPA